MGLLAGCALVPMAFVMLAIMVVLIVHEPLALVLLVGLIWVCRGVWRGYRALLRRSEQRT